MVLQYLTYLFQFRESLRHFYPTLFKDSLIILHNRQAETEGYAYMHIIHVHIIPENRRNTVFPFCIRFNIRCQIQHFSVPGKLSGKLSRPGIKDVRNLPAAYHDLQLIFHGNISYHFHIDLNVGVFCHISVCKTLEIIHIPLFRITVKPVQHNLLFAV